MTSPNPIPTKLSETDARYPSLLKDAFGSLLLPDLWIIGNPALLGAKSVGFCGSRHASERGLEVAADCARQLSSAGAVVVSGYAPGVDMASHEAALGAGGRTIIVLAEGIERFRVKKTIKPLWDWDRILVVSQFNPGAIWRADRAMERNKVIVALSHAIIVLEAREQGGTLNAGYSALSMRKPLFVAMYDEMNGSREGNQRLIREGGKPLLRSRTTSKPKCVTCSQMWA
jgi:DNA processing protein